MRVLILLGCCYALTLAGCGSKKTSWLTTVPVSGTVLVDGKPVGSVQLKFNRVGGVNPQYPAAPTAFTNEDGSFQAATFEAGDGLPEGKYQVTFFWGELDLFSMQYGGEDKLDGRYENPEASEFIIDVTEGSPVDMGEIRLTSK